jgi:hypothetical protein
VSLSAQIDDELTAAVDYVPGARGHTVLALGPEADGTEALAVWRLGPTGVASGAWVIRTAEEDAADRIARVLGSVRERCLVGWTVEEPAAVLDKFADRLPSDLVTALRANIAPLPDLVAEIAQARQRYAAAVDEYRLTSKSKLIPLTWERELPAAAAAGDPTAVGRLLAPQPVAASSPVAAIALELAGALATAVDLWHDTEQRRFRRTYLRRFGDPQPLPPRWLARLLAANTASYDRTDRRD